MAGAISSQNVKAIDMNAGYTTAERILKNEATRMLFVKIITIFEIAKTDRIETNVFFRSNFEKSNGINRPVIAIVNVNELTYNPEIAIVVLKYSDI